MKSPLTRILRQTFVLGICLLFSVMPACMTKKAGSDVRNRDDGQTEFSERCKMKHDPGPCRGAFTRYYFDQKEGTCKSFIYGGCEGVVPFETLEDCQTACAR